MDENHLANLLNVFTAFIMPPPAKPVPRDESPLLMLLDEGELMPSTSSQANATSLSKDGTPKEHGPIELSEEFVQLLYRASIYKILQSYLANDSGLFSPCALFYKKNIFSFGHIKTCQRF
jgi:hypothetical protein